MLQPRAKDSHPPHPAPISPHDAPCHTLRACYKGSTYLQSVVNVALPLVHCGRLHYSPIRVGEPVAGAVCLPSTVCSTGANTTHCRHMPFCHSTEQGRPTSTEGDANLTWSLYVLQLVDLQLKQRGRLLQTCPPCAQSPKVTLQASRVTNVEN
jgi:hypothetical protein